MLAVSSSAAWHNTHPGAIIGLLELSNVAGGDASLSLTTRKRAIEQQLREQYKGYTRQDFLALPVMACYDRYYRQFSKTYHVLQQVESIALKGRNLPDVLPAVDANFMAEVETLVLTAGHDVARLRGAVAIDVSQPGDQITQMNGTTREIRDGDMIMRDADGIACSIIYGQDSRSPIAPATAHVLYVAYAPPGVAETAVDRQLRKIEEHVRLFAADAVVEQRRLLVA